MTGDVTLSGTAGATTAVVTGSGTTYNVANSGLTPAIPERDAAIAAFGAGGVTGRAAALRSIVESQTLRDREFRRAFVLLEYFGYLRRSPDEAPNTDFSGYDFWLQKLNQFNGDYIASEMVRSFIVSPEYRARYGQP